MPLLPNLERIHRGERPRYVVIATLTADQLTAMNALRLARRYSPMEADVIFIGKHIYNSRLARDGYNFCDIIDQLENALADESIMADTPPMTSMQNPQARVDRYGNSNIRDLVVFECSLRYPRAELYSVVPKGDGLKPQKGNAPHCELCGAFLNS